MPTTLRKSRHELLRSSQSGRLSPEGGLIVVPVTYSAGGAMLGAALPPTGDVNFDIAKGLIGLGLGLGAGLVTDFAILIRIARRKPSPETTSNDDD
ncbi:MAG TPA: hypothetical protein VL944_02015 [Candidatus Acidoferrum sp.]|nr:hypothetical protein [Candidatus Acidoferrum sp.]